MTRFCGKALVKDPIIPQASVNINTVILQILVGAYVFGPLYIQHYSLCQCSTL